MKTQLKRLEKKLGSPEKAAKALGYTERRYRDFKSGVAPIPKAVKLAIQQLLDKKGE